MDLPSPPIGPPKYSATSAEITASDEAIRSPVNRYGAAVGSVTAELLLAAGSRRSAHQVAVHGSTWRSPRRVLM